MPPIRWSNRVPKPRDYWDPPISSTRRRQPPSFTIYTEPPEDPSMQLLDELRMHLSKDLNTQPIEGLDTQPTKGLDTRPAEDLEMQSPEDLATQVLEDQPYQPRFLSI